MTRRACGKRAWRMVMTGLAMGVGFAAGAHAQQDPKAVDQAVRAAVAATTPANSAITLGPAMGAHYMKPCTRPLDVTITGHPPYEQAAVRCPAPLWTLYVSVTVDPKMAIVVAARPIPGGLALKASDIKVQEEPYSLYAGRQVYTSVSDVLGATAVMTLPPGAIITGSNIQRPVLVQAGQIILVQVENHGVNITLDARADQSGRLGDQISVSNMTTGKHFQAKLTQDGALIQLSP